MAEELAIARQQDSEGAIADRASDQTRESAYPGAIILRPDANGVLVLPAGVELDDIDIQGRDLVIRADGQVYVIIDGAVFVPEIVVDGMPVPAAQIAALLIGTEREVPAGPRLPKPRDTKRLEVAAERLRVLDRLGHDGFIVGKGKFARYFGATFGVRLVALENLNTATRSTCSKRTGNSLPSSAGQN